MSSIMKLMVKSVESPRKSSSQGSSLSSARLKRLARMAMAACIATMIPSVGFCDIIFSNNDYDANANNRFSNSSSFVLNGLNVSGVGQTNGGGVNGYGIWATLISDNVIVSANHYRPNSPIFFYPNNNPSSTPFTYTVVSGQQIGQSDFWVGRLNAPVDPSISRYSFATQAFSGPNNTLVSAGIYQNLNGYHFGISPSNNSLSQDQAVGRNVIDGFIDNLPAGPSGGFPQSPTLDVLYLANGGLSNVTHETVVQIGDSGAPFFINQSGSLLLLGLNSALFSNNSGTGVSYIGNYASDIQNFINVNAVPEPSAMVLVGLSAGYWVIRRHRSRKLATGK
jgi:hypothetical protein